MKARPTTSFLLVLLLTGALVVPAAAVARNANYTVSEWESGVGGGRPEISVKVKNNEQNLPGEPQSDKFQLVVNRAVGGVLMGSDTQSISRGGEVKTLSVTFSDNSRAGQETVYTAMVLPTGSFFDGSALPQNATRTFVLTPLESDDTNGNGGGNGAVGGILPPELFRPLDPDVETNLQSGEGLLNIVATVSNWVFAIFLAISIIYLLMAAFQFVTGGPASVDEARQKLILAAVGIGIALIALGIPRILRNIIAGVS